MVPEVFAHRVTIESIEEGTAVARLEPGPHAAADADLETEAVIALAQHSSRAALDGAVRSVRGSVRFKPIHSEVRHLRSSAGPLSAAALLDRELASELVDDIRRIGSTRARVNVAVVDDEGETIALGNFEFDVAHP
jgi:hypothetical protein